MPEAVVAAPQRSAVVNVLAPVTVMLWKRLPM